MMSGVAQPILAQAKPAPNLRGRRRSERLHRRGLGLLHHDWRRRPDTRHAPDLAIGPEVAYLDGEFGALEASNVTVTGNITFDFIRDHPDGASCPCSFAAGGGYLRQKPLSAADQNPRRCVPFTSIEGTVSAGLGARIAIGSHMFVAPEFRLGWEPETRIAVTIGMRLR